MNCDRCGIESELVNIDGENVCSTCKSLVLQTIREGVVEPENKPKSKRSILMLVGINFFGVIAILFYVNIIPFLQTRFWMPWGHFKVHCHLWCLVIFKSTFSRL